MSSSFVRDLLVNAIACAKANERAQAKRLLERALNLDLDNQQEIEALYWLSEVTDDVNEKRDHLETILAMDMSDGRARRKLAILNGQIKPEEIINPDTPQPIVVADPQSIGVKRFVCPQCGGKMVFRPDGQSLICESCDSKAKTQPQEETDFAQEQDFFVALATTKGHHRMMAMRISLCKGCGSTFILHPTQLTLTCPYCSSPHVVQDQDNKEFVAPTGIIPFSIDEQAAKRTLKAWLQQKLSNEPIQVKKGMGIYIPIWTFDIAGAIPYRYQIYHEKKWVTVSGENYLLRNDIPVPATKNIDRLWQEQIDQYDLLKTIEYKDEYLADWPAETYQISVADASLRARELVFSAEKRQIISDTGAPLDNLVVTSEKMRVDSYKLVLLPLWVISYWHEQRSYKVTINGQNGCVIGETPANGLRKWVGKIFREE